MTIGTNAGGFTPPVSGGLAPYTWIGTNFPAGVSINATTGGITGVVTSGTRYISTITVIDSLGGQSVLTVVCNVTGAPADLRVTSAVADRNTVVNAAPASLGLTASGGTTPYSWSATNLPTGLTLTSAGALVNRPTASGVYVVTLKVTGPAAKMASYMFTWTVT
jgi:hypothetical protein